MKFYSSDFAATNNRMIPLKTVLNCPNVHEPILTFTSFCPKATPIHIAAKLNNADAVETSSGDNPTAPAPRPLPKAFNEMDIPNTMISKKPIFLLCTKPVSYEVFSVCLAGRISSKILRPNTDKITAPMADDHTPGNMVAIRCPNMIPASLGGFESLELHMRSRRQISKTCHRKRLLTKLNSISKYQATLHERYPQQHTHLAIRSKDPDKYCW